MEYVTSSLISFLEQNLKTYKRKWALRMSCLTASGEVLSRQGEQWPQATALGYRWSDCSWCGKALPSLPQKQVTVKNTTLQAFPWPHNVLGRERIKTPPSQPLPHAFVQATVLHCCSLNLAVPAHFNSWKCAPKKSLPVFNSKCRGKSSNSSSTTAEFSIDGK